MPTERGLNKHRGRRQKSKKGERLMKDIERQEKEKYKKEKYPARCRTGYSLTSYPGQKDVKRENMKRRYLYDYCTCYLNYKYITETRNYIRSIKLHNSN